MLLYTEKIMNNPSGEICLKGENRMGSRTKFSTSKLDISIKIINFWRFCRTLAPKTLDDKKRGSYTLLHLILNNIELHGEITDEYDYACHQSSH